MKLILRPRHLPKKVEVELFGEEDHEAVLLEGTLLDAYQTTEEFCRVLAKRMRSAGFMRTLLLKRMGSSIEAGRNTTEKLIRKAQGDWDEEDEEVGSVLIDEMTDHELGLLVKVLKFLDSYRELDPKYHKLKELLDQGIPSDGKPWRDYGCILFSQYFDTVHYMAQRFQ